MEATHSSRSSSNESIEFDPKLELVEDPTPASAPTTSAVSGAGKGESSVPVGEVAKPDGDDDAAVVLRRKANKWGIVRDMRVPESQISGSCSSCCDGDSDLDLCSSSDEDDGECYDPFASGVVPPVLPDIQLRVPMENAYDVQRVRDALLIKGVLDVVCDEGRQIVTVTGTVPPIRLLKKVRKVNRQARIISTSSPFAAFVNPHITRSSQFELHEELQESAPIDIPSSGSGIPNFVVLPQRPRPTFQRFNFHNDPHSPYLRTFSPSDLSPESSLGNSSTSGSGDRRHWDDSPLFDDDSYQGNEFIFA